MAAALFTVARTFDLFKHFTFPTQPDWKIEKNIHIIEMNNTAIQIHLKHHSTTRTWTLVRTEPYRWSWSIDHLYLIQWFMQSLLQTNRTISIRRAINLLWTDLTWEDRCSSDHRWCDGRCLGGGSESRSLDSGGQTHLQHCGQGMSHHAINHQLPLYTRPVSNSDCTSLSMGSRDRAGHFE